LITEEETMPTDHESPAIAIARAHVHAWSNHDFDTARGSLAADVKVTATTTQPVMPDTNLAGIDDYMRGLIQFAQGVVPGSARVIVSVGDDRNALLMLTVEADLGGGKVTLPAARLYLLDEYGKIKNEQVVFYVAAD
jgi:SnoaL-like domain